MAIVLPGKFDQACQYHTQGKVVAHQGAQDDRCAFGLLRSDLGGVIKFTSDGAVCQPSGVRGCPSSFGPTYVGR